MKAWAGWSMVAASCALGVGLGVGVALRSVPRAAEQPEARASSASDTATDVDVEERCAALREQAEAQRSTLESLRFRARLIEGQLATIGGVPVPWPDDAVRAERETAVLALVDELAATVPGFPEAAVDCEELPCLLALHERSDGIPVFSMDDEVDSAFDLVQDAMASHGFQPRLHRVQGKTIPVPDAPKVQVYAAPLRMPEEDAGAREKVRLSRFLDAQAAAVRASEP